MSFKDVNNFLFSAFQDSKQQKVQIIGDSPVKINMSRIDKLFFPGERAHDVATFMQLIKTQKKFKSTLQYAFLRKKRCL